MISNVKKVMFVVFNLQKWHQNMQLQIFIQANITAMGEKN